jgi:hypothetical protein
MRSYGRFLLGLVILGFAFCNERLLAEDWTPIHQKAKDSVFYLEATKQRRDGTNPQKFTSTGFVAQKLAALQLPTLSLKKLPTAWCITTHRLEVDTLTNFQLK